MNTKIHIISDTHTRHNELCLPGGDVLIHCGDFMSSGYDTTKAGNFLDWLDKQPYMKKILIAGNHDRVFEGLPNTMQEILQSYPNVHYLQDSSININGIKYYGTPWSPEFCGWAFSNKNRQQAKERFEKIPMDTDVLITHGPAYGILDQVLTRDILSEKKHLGCKELLKVVYKVKPKLHCFGHIHSSQGKLLNIDIGNTMHINAACLGETYEFNNKDHYQEFTFKS